ncbi:hypothetical protein B4U80_13364, partial [Leptotrombidium deliense]
TKAATLLKQLKENDKSNLDSTPYWKFLKQIECLDKKIVNLPIDEITDNMQRVPKDNVYKIGFDYPGFRAKDLRVYLNGNLLKIESIKECDEDKKFTYQNSYEELLPQEADLEDIKVNFDVSNGFLIIEVPLPENSNVDEIRRQTAGLNEELKKLKINSEQSKENVAKSNDSKSKDGKTGGNK